MRCCQPLPVFTGTAGKPAVPRDLSPAKSAGADDGVRAGRGTKERPHLRCVPETDGWCVPEGPRRWAFTSVTGRGSREGPRQSSDRGLRLSSSGRSDGSLAARSTVHGRIVDQGAESGQQRVESDFELVVAANLREDVGVLNQ